LILTDALGWRTKKRYLMNRISTVVVGSDPVLVGEQILIDSCSSSSEFYFDVWESHLYACEKSYDGSSSTAWSSYNEGAGAWIDLNFNESVGINRINLYNRCGVYNSKQMLLSLRDGSNQTIEATDACAYTLLQLELVETTYVRITILSYYDNPLILGFMEVEFYGPSKAPSMNRGYSFRNPPNFNPIPKNPWC